MISESLSGAVRKAYVSRQQQQGKKLRLGMLSCFCKKASASDQKRRDLVSQGSSSHPSATTFTGVE